MFCFSPKSFKPFQTLTKCNIKPRRNLLQLYKSTQRYSNFQENIKKDTKKNVWDTSISNIFLLNGMIEIQKNVERSLKVVKRTKEAIMFGCFGLILLEERTSLTKKIIKIIYKFEKRNQMTKKIQVFGFEPVVKRKTRSLKLLVKVWYCLKILKIENNKI